MKWIRCVDCATKIVTLKGQRQRCNECKRLWGIASNKAWRLRNKNKIKLRMAAWGKRNKEILKLKRGARYQQNRSRIIAKSREYYRKNRTEVLAKTRVYGKGYYARPEIKQKSHFRAKKNQWLRRMQSIRGFTTQERELNEKRYANRTN